MGNVLLLRSTYREAASVVDSGGWYGSTPASEMLELQPTRRAVADGAGAIYVVLDLGADLPVSAVGMLYTNASSATEWRVRMDSAEGNLTGSPEYDSTQVDVWPGSMGFTGWEYSHGFIECGAVYTVRYVRIDVFNHSGDFEAGVVMVDDAFEPTRNIEVRHSPPQWKQEKKEIVAHGGAKYSGFRPRFRVSTFTLRAHESAKQEFYSGVYELGRTHGVTVPVLFVHEPGDDYVGRGIVYAKMSEAIDLSIPDMGIFEARFELEESL